MNVSALLAYVSALDVSFRAKEAYIEGINFNSASIGFKIDRVDWDQLGSSGIKQPTKTESTFLPTFAPSLLLCLFVCGLLC